jgi:hypothetical protein
MFKNQFGPLVAMVMLLTTSAHAAGIDVLRGKFAFNWLNDPAKAKCIKVDGKLLSEFKSARYHCDLKANSNSSSGASSRTCTQIPRNKEYLIFDTKHACDEERDTQASNE